MEFLEAKIQPHTLKKLHHFVRYQFFRDYFEFIREQMSVSALEWDSMVPNSIQSAFNKVWLSNKRK